MFNFASENYVQKTNWKRDCRYQSSRGERAKGFCMTGKPAQWFAGYNMPITGEVRGLRRNPIKYRVIYTWNETFTDGVTTSIEMTGATKRDKKSLFVNGDIMQIVHDVVEFIKEMEA